MSDGSKQSLTAVCPIHLCHNAKPFDFA